MSIHSALMTPMRLKALADEKDAAVHALAQPLDAEMAGESPAARTIQMKLRKKGLGAILSEALGKDEYQDLTENARFTRGRA